LWDSWFIESTCLNQLLDLNRGYSLPKGFEGLLNKSEDYKNQGFSRIILTKKWAILANFRQKLDKNIKIQILPLNYNNSKTVPRSLFPLAF
jgi:hypothetical protein